MSSIDINETSRRGTAAYTALEIVPAAEHALDHTEGIPTDDHNAILHLTGLLGELADAIRFCPHSKQAAAERLAGYALAVVIRCQREEAAS